MTKETPTARACAIAVIATIVEAAKLPSRNPNLAVLVFPLVFLPFSLLVLLHALLASPLLERVEDDAHEISLLDQSDWRAIVATESVFLLSFSVVSFLGMLLVVRVSDLVYNGVDQGVSVRDLLTRVRSTWRTPLVAWISVSILTIADVIAVVLTTWNDINIGWSCLVMVLAAVGYLWFTAFGNLVLVVSVLEDNIGDLKSAVTRSWKLMRGKRKEGFGVMLVLEMMSVPIYMVFFVITTDDDDVLGMLARLGFGYVATLVVCITRFFLFVVFTVFYYECRKSHGEKLVTELGNACCYKAVADDSDLSDSLNA